MNTEAESTETETAVPDTEAATTVGETAAPETEAKAPETEATAPETESTVPETESTAPDSPPADDAAGRSARRGWWLPVSLLVVAALLLALGISLQVRRHQLRSTHAASNAALVDTGATSRLVGQVSTSLNKVLSYSYANPSATQQAAAQLLTGDAAGQYKTLFTALSQKAPGEKLTLSAKVVVAGVTSLHGNTAQLLVFLDQSSMRASDRQSSTSAAQLDVTAVQQGGVWKISELLPL